MERGLVNGNNIWNKLPNLCDRIYPQEPLKIVRESVLLDANNQPIPLNVATHIYIAKEPVQVKISL